MDLSKIKTLIDFVGRSQVTELAVSEKETTVRIFQNRPGRAAFPDTGIGGQNSSEVRQTEAAKPQAGLVVTAPVFGILHTSPSPGDPPFVAAGDHVVEGQTLFIIEAMKVFNTVTSPCAGRILRVTDVNGSDVAAGDMLAVIE